MKPARSILNVAAAAGLAVALAGARPDGAQQPTFRASVDLIAVDVQVMDSTGRPMSGLDPAKFEVTIDGKRRRVVSADFISHGTASVESIRPTVAGPLATNAPPLAGKPSRIFIMAIDAGSFESGDTIPVLQAARGFIDRLQPEDLVGVFTMPPFGPHVEPTSDRTAARHVLDAISGQRQSMQSQFNLTTSEIVDIMAGTGGMGSPMGRSPAPVTPAGSGTAGPVFTDLDVLARVQLRECRQATDPACLESIVSEAAALAGHLQERVTQGLNGIIALLDSISQLPQRKTVVVISAGMPVSDRPGGSVDIGEEAKHLGEQAARANAVVYALHIDLGLSKAFSAQARRARDSGTVARDSRVSSRLLEEFASASGGALMPVRVGAGENALDRVLLEASGYYVLGVEPMDRDRDGRVHRLSVKTAQRGATIRSRQWVMAGKKER